MKSAADDRSNTNPIPTASSALEQDGPVHGLPSKRSWRRTILFSLIPLLAVFVIIELCSRLILLCVSYKKPVDGEYGWAAYDAELGWRLTPGLRARIVDQARQFSFLHETNGKGFRTGLARDVSPREADIILLGDSNAYGFGVDAGVSMAGQLETITGRTVCIAGVPGYGVDQFWLRLKQVPTLRSGAVVVVLVSPVNDTVNASMAVDYGMRRPRVNARSGAVERYASLLPTKSSLYALQEFEQVNERSRLDPPGDRPWLDFWIHHSAACRLLICHSRYTWTNTDKETKEVRWNFVSDQAYLQERLDLIAANPHIFAARVWTEMAEFGDAREAAVMRSKDFLALMKREVEQKGGRLLVAINPDPYRATTYFQTLTDALQKGLPDSRFDWGWTRKRLTEQLRARGVTTMMAIDPASMEERLYIHYDDHLGPEGHRLAAERVAEMIRDLLPKRKRSSQARSD